MQVRRMIGLMVLAALLVVSACSSDGGARKAASKTPSTSSTTTQVPRPPGPAANLSHELSGGDGVMLAAATTGPKLADAGWVQHEYLAAGKATSYRSDGPLPKNGRFQLQPAKTADYRTRIVVRRPESAAKFNGTVVVEWLNVSGGLDASPDYSFMASELLRRGYAWVGVSAQAIGVEGGPVAVSVGGAAGDLAGKGLKALDPPRYGSLHHPGDAYSYDIFTQVARGLRAKGASGALGALQPERIIAAGESQSAFALTTYVDGVQPLTKAFDGFLVHSRGGAPAPLGESGGPIDIASALTGQPTIIRTDTDVPVLILETETDVVSILGYYPARQDDSARIRLWEVAGTAHADRFLTGSVADSLDCGVAINDGPQQYIVRAALRAMDTWVRDGKAPPNAPRLDVQVTAGKPALRRNADGIAEGGIRTPQVDVPVATLSGAPGPSPSVICLLLGSTVPLSKARLAQLHPSRAAYLKDYEASTDAVIKAGFVLPNDRKTMLADAEPDRLPS